METAYVWNRCCITGPYHALFRCNAEFLSVASQGDIAAIARAAVDVSRLQTDGRAGGHFSRPTEAELVQQILNVCVVHSVCVVVRFGDTERVCCSF